MSHLNYCNIVFGCATPWFVQPLIVLQKKNLRHVIKAKSNSHCEPIFIQLALLNFDDQIAFFQAVHMHKYHRGILQKSFLGMHTLKSQIGQDRIRSDDSCYMIPPSLHGFRFPHLEAAKTWNKLPHKLKTIEKESRYINMN